MIKKITIALLAAAAICLMGCSADTGNTADSTATQTSDAEAYLSEHYGNSEAGEKLPDADAPDLTVISVYQKNPLGGIVKKMDAVDTLDPITIFTKLQEYGVIDADASIEEYQVADGVALLKVDVLSDQSKENVMAITNTFIENFNDVTKMTLKVKETVIIKEDNYHTEYKEIK